MLSAGGARRSAECRGGAPCQIWDSEDQISFDLILRRMFKSSAEKADDLRGVANAKLNMRLCEEHTAGEDRIALRKCAAYHVIHRVKIEE